MYANVTAEIQRPATAAIVARTSEGGKVESEGYWHNIQVLVGSVGAGSFGFGLRFMRSGFNFSNFKGCIAVTINNAQAHDVQADNGIPCTCLAFP